VSKTVFMIAGPNGAGKTTTAMPFLSKDPVVYEFLNADEIARGLAPVHPESMALRASKLMLARLQELLEVDRSFAFETTGAGINYIKHLKKAQTKGYKIHLLFLWLSSPELAIQRVAHRVAQGGHLIPEETVKRRYYGGLKNLIQHYLPLVDSAIILDNSAKSTDNIIAIKDIPCGLQINKPDIWEKIKQVTDAE